ncbi:MAG: DUF1186 domain-containing protein [Lentisphaerae bacterium]|nr:DUF1186 domain-containing protein [Lentisphaerota bacterium]
MRVLLDKDLDASDLRPAFERTLAHLEAGDFRAAEVKKLNPGPYYRAKLSDADRLIFRFGNWRGENCLLVLEIVRNHDYAASRFLRGAAVDEARLVPVERPAPVQPDDAVPMAYVNPARRHVHVLDKILSFDDDQEEALMQRPPLILIGSAGSGKTVLTLEKLRQLPGEILYVTHSSYLVDNARAIYYAHHYENEGQEVDFLSFQEYVESIAVPEGRPLAFADFAAWFSRVRGGTPVRNSHALYEEFNGVLTGSSPGQPYLTRDEYLALGVRRSIFPAEQRPAVYDLFRRYLDYLPGSGCYDLNLVCHGHHALCRPAYDFLVADEVQDMTAVQLSLALRGLRRRDQFVLCGDANQIVHPNFFSWAGLKTMFYERHAGTRAELVRVLNANYRNAPAVIDIANRLLRIKQARFGSIDRESHHLIRPVSDRPGGVTFLEDTRAARTELDSKTARSARFAVIVLREEDKEEARRSFHTPLVFSVREAKGLEYENIILPGLISSQPAAFREIAAGVTESDLQGEFTYSRARDKSDRALDAFKFYINAFYVALTRAITHVYILEHDFNHPLLRLLKLQTAKGTGLTEQQSSDEEWRAEALRLERQGKHDQVEAIRRTILRVEPVPWPVLTAAAAEKMARDTFASPNRDHKALRLLLDYAATYGVPHLLESLAQAGFKSARQPETARNTAMQRHCVDYHQRGYRDLFRKIERHGVDFRNPLNQTPLMLAVQLGLDGLAVQLIERGAKLTEADNWGRMPLHYALRAAYQNPLYARRQLECLYPLLSPPATNVRVGRRLVQVDRHRPAFFLLHSMLARFEMLLRDKLQRDVPGFETADFVRTLEAFPESVIATRHRTRQALTATLAGNEVARQAPRNRQLFVRIRRGYYLPNPCLELEQNGVWTNVLDLLHISDLEREPDQERLGHFLAYIRRLQKRIAAELEKQAAEPVPGAAKVAGTTAPAGSRTAEVAGTTAPAGPRTAEVAGTAAPAGPSPAGTLAPAEPNPAGTIAPAGSARLVEAAYPSIPGGTATPAAGAAAAIASPIGEQQLLLNLDGEATPAAPLLPDHAVLTPEPSPLGPDGPRAPASADEQWRHASCLKALRSRAWTNMYRLKWMTREPRPGAACLLEFLEETVDPRRKTIASARDEGCMYAMLQLAEWREPRAYPLILRLIQRLDCNRWSISPAQRLHYVASSLAACCDGNLALLRELILDTGTNPGSRAMALGAVAYLAVRRGLDHAIAQQCFRTILTEPFSRDITWVDGAILLINLAAIDAWCLYPVALRGELEAAVRSRWIPRRNLTLKKIAQRAAMPEWERGELVNSRYALPRDVWMLITEKHSILEDNLGYGDDEEWEDESDHEPWHRSFSPGVTDERFLHPDAGWLPAGQPPSDHAWPAGQPPSDHAWPAASEGKVGRNDPCPCGSGKKYKKCCGAR